MYALKTWESPAKKMLEKYKEYLTEDEVFVMTAAEQLKQQGLQQGLQQGALEKARETALTMLKDGLSPDTVAKYSGLDRQVLAQLQTDIPSKPH